MHVSFCFQIRAISVYFSTHTSTMVTEKRGGVHWKAEPKFYNLFREALFCKGIKLSTIISNSKNFENFLLFPWKFCLFKLANNFNLTLQAFVYRTLY